MYPLVFAKIIKPSRKAPFSLTFSSKKMLVREEEDKAEAEKKTKSEDTKEEEKAYSSTKREEEEEEDEDGDDESTGLLSTSHRREEEDEDEEKKEDDHHLRRGHHQNQTASSSISATRHIYPNVLEDGDGENENCAVGVPVLADGSIDFNAYERGGGGGGGGGRERTIQTTTTRDYARALAESEGNQDVSVLLEDPSSSTSPQSSSRNFVELQSYSTGLFDIYIWTR